MILVVKHLNFVYQIHKSCYCDWNEHNVHILQKLQA